MKSKNYSKKQGMTKSSKKTKKEHREVSDKGEPTFFNPVFYNVFLSSYVSKDGKFKN